MRVIQFALVVLMTAQVAYGQYQIGLIPRESPDRSVSQIIGYTEIEIRYGSPSVKGRKVWGDLVPYDKVWRAGSNKATTVAFSKDVKIDGKILRKGKYGFFVLPKEKDKWVVIFNKVSDQWGAFKYSESEDALRINVLPGLNTVRREALEFSIRQFGFQYGEIVLEWDLVRIEIEVDTDYLKGFENTIEERAAKCDINIKWVAFLQGAEYLERINKKLDLAAEWVGKSEGYLKEVLAWNKQYYPKEYIEGNLLWVKAKILARQGEYHLAVDLAERVKTLYGNGQFYMKKNTSEDIDAMVDAWREKGE